MSDNLIDISGSLEEVNSHLYEENLTDGLPIIPPTEDRVKDMLSGTTREADEVIAEIPPEYADATIEKIAANAVMAGCKPEYLSVVITAIEALSEEEYNLYGANATTHNSAPLIIVNGPIVEELNINYGASVFGSSGWRANSTIGRAVRLIMLNIGRCIPGETDKSTFSHPGKYTYCIAENERSSPWDPLHVRRGYEEDQNAVTVFKADAPQSILSTQSDPKEILSIVSNTIATPGNNHGYYSGEIGIAFGPEDANTLSDGGYGVKDVQKILHNYARVKHSKLKQNGYYEYRQWPKSWETSDDDAKIPLVEDPSDFLILVTGGAGTFSMALPSWGAQTQSVTKKIET